MGLKNDLIKLGATNPELRPHIRPLLAKLAGAPADPRPGMFLTNKKTREKWQVEKVYPDGSILLISPDGPDSHGIPGLGSFRLEMDKPQATRQWIFPPEAFDDEY